MYYEQLKHTGQMPIIGVNTFQDPEDDYEDTAASVELSRATEAEKQSQLRRLAEFKKKNEKKKH